MQISRSLSIRALLLQLVNGNWILLNWQTQAREARGLFYPPLDTAGGKEINEEIVIN